MSLRHTYNMPSMVPNVTSVGARIGTGVYRGNDVPPGNAYMFSIGVANFGDPANFGYNFNTASWDAFAAHPPSPIVTNGACASINGIIYVSGGYNGGYVADTYAFNPATNTWSGPLAPMPTPRTDVGVAVYNGRMYVMGGVSAASTPFESTAVEYYDPVANAWTAVQVLPVPMERMVCGTIGSKIYVATGAANVPPFTDPYGGCFEYTPGSNTWAVKASTATPVVDACGGAVNGKLYVVGGDTHIGTPTTLTNMAQVYDPATNTWSTVAVWPITAVQAAACVKGNTLYTTGGSTTGSAVEALPDTYAFDTNAGTWSRLADMPGRYMGAKAAVI